MSQPLPTPPPYPIRDCSVRGLYAVLTQAQTWALALLDSQLPETAIHPDGGHWNVVECVAKIRPGVAAELPDPELIYSCSLLQLMMVRKQLKNVRKAWDAAVRRHWPHALPEFAYAQLFLADGIGRVLQSALLTPLEMQTALQVQQQELRRQCEHDS